MEERAEVGNILPLETWKSIIGTPNLSLLVQRIYLTQDFTLIVPMPMVQIDATNSTMPEACTNKVIIPMSFLRLDFPVVHY